MILRGHDLGAHAVEVVPMSGITNLARHLRAVPDGIRVTGLYDSAEGRYVRATLDRLGRSDPFFACDRDLEDELIRALGVARVTAVIERPATAGPGRPCSTSRSTATARRPTCCAGSWGRPAGGNSGMPGCSQRR